MKFIRSFCTLSVVDNKPNKDEQIYFLSNFVSRVVTAFRKYNLRLKCQVVQNLMDENSERLMHQILSTIRSSGLQRCFRPGKQYLWSEVKKKYHILMKRCPKDVNAFHNVVKKLHKNVTERIGSISNNANDLVNIRKRVTKSNQRADMQISKNCSTLLA